MISFLRRILVLFLIAGLICDRSAACGSPAGRFPAVRIVVPFSSQALSQQAAFFHNPEPHAVMVERYRSQFENYPNLRKMLEQTLDEPWAKIAAETGKGPMAIVVQMARYAQIWTIAFENTEKAEQFHDEIKEHFENIKLESAIELLARYAVDLSDNYPGWVQSRLPGGRSDVALYVGGLLWATVRMWKQEALQESRNKATGIASTAWAGLSRSEEKAGYPILRNREYERKIREAAQQENAPIIIKRAVLALERIAEKTHKKSALIEAAMDVLEADPTNARAYENLVWKYTTQVHPNYELAAFFASAWRESTPSNPHPWEWSLRVGVKRKAFDEVIKMAETFFERLGPFVSSTVRDYYAQALLGNGQREKALAVQLETVQRFPDSDHSQLTLAYVYLRSGNSIEALSRALEAGRLNSKNRHAFELAYSIASSIGDRYSTHQAAEALLALDRQNLEVRRNAAQARLEAGQSQKAQELAEESLVEYKTTDPASLDILTHAIKHARPLEALEQARSAAHLYPENPVLLLTQANLELYCGFFDEAEELALPLFQNPKTQIAAASILSRYNRKIGNFRLAEYYAKFELDMNFADPTAHFDLGMAFVKRGNMAGAIAEFEEVKAKDPRMVQARIELIKCLFASGQSNEASNEKEKALKIFPWRSKERERIQNAFNFEIRQCVIQQQQKKRVIPINKAGIGSLDHILAIAITLNVAVTLLVLLPHAFIPYVGGALLLSACVLLRWNYRTADSFAQAADQIKSGRLPDLLLLMTKLEHLFAEGSRRLIRKNATWMLNQDWKDQRNKVRMDIFTLTAKYKQRIPRSDLWNLFLSAGPMYTPDETRFLLENIRGDVPTEALVMRKMEWLIQATSFKSSLDSIRSMHAELMLWARAWSDRAMDQKYPVTRHTLWGQMLANDQRWPADLVVETLYDYAELIQDMPDASDLAFLSEQMKGLLEQTPARSPEEAAVIQKAVLGILIGYWESGWVDPMEPVWSMILTGASPIIPEIRNRARDYLQTRDDVPPTLLDQLIPTFQTAPHGLLFQKIRRHRQLVPFIRAVLTGDPGTYFAHIRQMRLGYAISDLSPEELKEYNSLIHQNAKAEGTLTALLSKPSYPYDRQLQFRKLLTERYGNHPGIFAINDLMAYLIREELYKDKSLSRLSNPELITKTRDRLNKLIGAYLKKQSNLQEESTLSIEGSTPVSSDDGLKLLEWWHDAGRDYENDSSMPVWISVLVQHIRGFFRDIRSVDDLIALWKKGDGTIKAISYPDGVFEFIIDTRPQSLKKSA
jgi:hypothetical protein